jgi:hypothetical protein
MDTKRLDWLNIGLMISALIIAKKFPFELFLFSYAFLGPLHYLTEINWLRDRNYFTQSKKIIWPMLLFAFGISINLVLNYLSTLNQTKEYFSFWLNSDFQIWMNKWNPAIIILALTTSLAIIYTKKLWVIILCIIGASIASYFLLQIHVTWLWIAVFTPTLVHVYIFTGLFMFYGALKNKSLPGLISVIVLVGCSIYILTSSIKNFNLPNQLIIQRFEDSSFSTVIEFFREYLGIENTIYKNINVTYVRILSFISFAYTYHYLNWFSKTSVIKWHNINSKKWILILSIWLISVLLYYINYKLGFVMLFALSFLHVFLEFPLNFITIKGIVDEFKNRLK